MDLTFFLIISAMPFLFIIAYYEYEERKKRQKELEERVKRLEERQEENQSQ